MTLFPRSPCFLLKKSIPLAEPGAHGAHKVDSIADADVALLDRLIDLARGHVALLTLAAEIPGLAAQKKKEKKKKEKKVNKTAQNRTEKEKYKLLG